MEEIPSIVKFENGSPEAIILLSKEKGLEGGSIKLVEGNEGEKREIVNNIMPDIGKVFFKEDAEDVRWQLMDAMEGPEDMKYIHRAFVQRWGIDEIEDKV